MRKNFNVLLLTIIVIGIFIQVGFAQDEIKEDLIMAGGGTTGVYYASAAAVGNLLVDELPYIKSAAAQVTGASVENVRLLQHGKADFGFASAATVVKAMDKEEPFEKEDFDNLRTICWAHSSFYHFIVDADSDIYSIEDFKGKRIRFDVPGSGAYVHIVQLLKEYGLSIDDVKPFMITSAWDAYKEGTIDVLPLGASLPYPYIVDIHKARPMRLIQLEPEKLDSFLENNKGYKIGVIPAGTYEGIDEDIITTDAAATFLTHKDVPEELVYQTVKLIAENIERLMLSIVYFEDWTFTPDITDRTGCPLHPGAERYYKEIGLIK